MKYFKQAVPFKMLKSAMVLCFLLLLSLNTYSNETGTKIETAFYFSVSINAKAEVVWPFLFQVDKWKYSVAKLENKYLSGDQEGGVVAAYPKESADKPGLLIKTLKIIPIKHYSFSIYSYAGQFVGFAAYDLKEENGKTDLTYYVYLQTRLSVTSDEQAAEQKQQMVESMEARQPKELAALKVLVES